jgi:hypothetical protein
MLQRKENASDEKDKKDHEKKDEGENPEDKPQSADKPDNEAVKKRDPSTSSRNKVSEVINIQHN